MRAILRILIISAYPLLTFADSQQLETTAQSFLSQHPIVAVEASRSHAEAKAKPEEARPSKETNTNAHQETKSDTSAIKVANELSHEKQIAQMNQIVRHMQDLRNNQNQIKADLDKTNKMQVEFNKNTQQLRVLHKNNIKQLNAILAQMTKTHSDIDDLTSKSLSNINAKQKIAILEHIKETQLALNDLKPQMAEAYNKNQEVQSQFHKLQQNIRSITDRASLLQQKNSNENIQFWTAYDKLDQKKRDRSIQFQQQLNMLSQSIMTGLTVIINQQISAPNAEMEANLASTVSNSLQIIMSVMQTAQMSQYQAMKSAEQVEEQNITALEQSTQNMSQQISSTLTALLELLNTVKQSMGYS